MKLGYVLNNRGSDVTKMGEVAEIPFSHTDQQLDSYSQTQL